MPEISELLERAVGGVTPTFGTNDLNGRAGTRRERRRRTRAIATLATLALIAGSVITIASGGDDRSVVATTAGKSVFRENTGTVLAFTDGLDGLVLVDLDNSRAVRRPMGGGSPTETSRPIRVRDSLIIGNQDGAAEAVPIDGSPARALGSATIAIDARGIGGVWLLEWPGGEVGTVPPTYRLVNVEGVERATPSGAAPELAPPYTVPAVGAGNYLMFESTDGVRVWNTLTNDVTIVGEGGALVGEASSSGRIFDWCPNSCNELHVVDFTQPDQPVTDTVVARLDPTRTFDVRNSSFSPHGRYLAVVTGTDDGPLTSESRGDLVLVDVLHQTHMTVARNIPRSSYLGWSPDGRQLFFSEYSWMRSTTDLGRFDLDARTLELTRLPFGNILSFLALDSRDASALLHATDGARSDCRSRNAHPSGRTSACGFKFSAPRRTPQDVATDLCLVTTATDLGVGGINLYSGDPFDPLSENKLRTYIPNSGEWNAERTPDGRYEFNSWWLTREGRTRVRVRAESIGGPSNATFEEVGNVGGIVSDPGCWQFTGRHRGETLTVTVLISAN